MNGSTFFVRQVLSRLGCWGNKGCARHVFRDRNMKKLHLLPLLIVAILAAFTSCNHQVYPIANLEYRYQENMSNVDAKQTVRIYYSDSQVKNKYVDIALVSYHPILPFKSIQEKKFLKKAVKKAYKQGGNAVVIQTIGFYKIIKEDRTTGKEESFVYDMTNANKFSDGSVNMMTEDMRESSIKLFMAEIQSCIDNATEAKEFEAIADKMSILRDYYDNLSDPNPSFLESLEALRNNYYDKINDNKDKWNLNSYAYDMTLADLFTSGKLSNKSKSMQELYIDFFKKDIEKSIDESRTLEEITAIKAKINALKQYNESLPKPKGQLTEDVEDFMDDVNSQERYVLKRIEKDRKKQEKKQGKTN